MPIKLLLFFAIILPLFSSAQTNYKEGYIITNEGDTIKGSVNYREWYNNPNKIDFKSASTSAATEITPATAREVTITGFDTYQRFKIAISMNALSFEKLNETADTASIIKTVFLKELIAGDHVNLYSYTDKLKERFYVLDKNKTTPEELQFVKFIKELQEQTKNIYRQQLIRLAVEYNVYTPKLQSKMQSVDYVESSLRNIVNQINTKSNNTVKSGSGIKHANTSFFAGIGIMQAKLHYSGQDLITSDGLDASGKNRYKTVKTTTLTPRIIAGINFYSKQSAHRLGIKTELSAYRFASTIMSYTKYNNYTPAENQYTFHLQGWSFTVTPQAVYKFYNTHALKAYLGAGLGLNFITTSKNSIYKLGVNQPLTFNETTNDYLDLKSANLIFTGRAGVVIKEKIDVYIYGSTPVDYNNGGSDFYIKSGVLAFCAAYNF